MRSLLTLCTRQVNAADLQGWTPLVHAVRVASKYNGVRTRYNGPRTRTYNGTIGQRQLFGGGGGGVRAILVLEAILDAKPSLSQSDHQGRKF